MGSRYYVDDDTLIDIIHLTLMKISMALLTKDKDLVNPDNILEDAKQVIEARSC